MKVYYNGSCNICNAEINQYKKSSQNINYIDISKYSDTDISHLDKKNFFEECMFMIKVNYIQALNHS